MKKKLLLLCLLALAAPLYLPIVSQAEHSERINKYLELKKDLLSFYAEPLALSELERFKNGGMAWTRNVDFFGRIALNLRGRDTAQLVRDMGLHDQITMMMDRRIDDVPFVDIIASPANATLDFERMGFFDLTIWAIPDGKNVTYYIDAMAGKENLQPGQGGPWYEFVLGSVAKERLQCALNRDLRNIIRQFARDFILVRSREPVVFDGIIPFSQRDDNATPPSEAGQPPAH